MYAGGGGDVSLGGFRVLGGHEQDHDTIQQGQGQGQSYLRMLRSLFLPASPIDEHGMAILSVRNIALSILPPPPLITSSPSLPHYPLTPPPGKPIPHLLKCVFKPDKAFSSAIEAVVPLIVHRATPTIIWYTPTYPPLIY